MGLEIIDQLKAKNGLDFPLADANDLKGGWMTVATVSERDAIPLSKRKFGMVVYVKAGHQHFQMLSNGLLNAGWQALELGDGSSNNPNHGIGEQLIRSDYWFELQSATGRAYSTSFGLQTGSIYAFPFWEDLPFSPAQVGLRIASGSANPYQMQIGLYRFGDLGLGDSYVPKELIWESGELSPDVGNNKNLKMNCGIELPAGLLAFAIQHNSPDAISFQGISPNHVRYAYGAGYSQPSSNGSGNHFVDSLSYATQMPNPMPVLSFKVNTTAQNIPILKFRKA
jgi:hypothetical protein